MVHCPALIRFRKTKSFSGWDLRTICKLSLSYKLTGEHYHRIKPELGKEAECSAVKNYLLQCMQQDVTDDESIETRWDAARTLHLWLRQLHEGGDVADVIADVSRAITELFLGSGDEIRIAIEQGFLEHALESAALRPYFEHWSRDERLREAWENAVAWANDHPDFSWNLHQEFLRKIQEP